jgi:hypothetical protein
MSLKKSIKKILKEETSLQGKLNQLIKSKGIVVASKSVGGFENLTKLLELDLSDMNTQEKLVKNFINFGQFSNVTVSFMEIRNSPSGNRIIDVHYVHEFNNPFWGEIADQIIRELNNFFPFKVKNARHPAFSSTNRPKISIDVTPIEEEEEPNEEEEDMLQESKKNEHTPLQNKLNQLIKSKGIKLASKSTGGFENLIKILDLDEEGYDNLIYQYLTENYYPDYNWGPKLHNFYKKDIKQYGLYEFLVNDVPSYVYLGEWDGYDYLYTLSISEWIVDELTTMFGDKWIPTFKKWFEDNSGLEVREIDLNDKFNLL